MKLITINGNRDIPFEFDDRFKDENSEIELLVIVSPHKIEADLIEDNMIAKVRIVSIRLAE